MRMINKSSLRFLKSNFNWYFPLFIIVVICIGAAASFYVYNKINETNKISLIKRADTIALAIDSSEISILNGNESDLQNTSYLDLKKKLTLIREANSDSRFVYIVGKNGGNVFFFVDSEDPSSEDYSPPGEIYPDESMAFDVGFGDGVSGFEGPLKDSFGTWVTGVSAIKDKNGNVVGLVGIDVDAKNYINTALTYASIPLLVAFVLATFAYAGLRIRRAEEEWLELKSQFVAVASHELRSPLTGITFALPLLVEDQSISPDNRKILEQMNISTKRLLEIVNDILDAALFESSASVAFENVDLRDVITDSISATSFYANDKKIKVNCALGNKAVIVLGNKNKLVRAVSNILSNAVKYSLNGGEVSIKLDSKGGRASILVSDRGIGIPKSEQEKVFRGFYRATNAKKSLVEGSGLGMYLVSKILQAHGGAVDVHSEEGKGTKILLLLPVKKI